jgi:hypothetical protein
MHEAGVERANPIPGSPDLLVHVELAHVDQHGVRREDLQERPRYRRTVVGAAPEVHGQDVGLADLAHGSLIEDVEGSEGDDLVSPKLNPDRLARPNREQIENPPSHGELPDLLHQGHPFEAPDLQGCREGLKIDGVTDAYAQAEAGQRGGKGHTLLKGSWRGDEDVGAPGEQPFHGLHPQGANLQVRLCLLVGKRLLLGVHHRRPRPPQENLEVRFGGGSLARPSGEGDEHATGL